MDQSKHTPSDLAETTTPQKQQEDVIETNSFVNPSPEIGKSKVSLPCNIAFDVIYVLLACNITIDITFDNLGGSTKKQQLEKKGKEPLKKRKRVEKPKNKAEERKKMDKRKGKKKLEVDDEDYEIEEPQDKRVKKKKIEREFKSLRAKTTVKPLYKATKTLTPERKTKIREMGFGTLLDFPFEKIPGKLPYFVEVLGIPMGKKKLESDSPREYDDEFLKAFKVQFHDKKYITITDLSKQIQRTTNTDFMFQMNYLMLFSNCMIHCDNSSRLIYYVIKNIKSTYIISDFDWCKFIWDHIKTSKNTWDDRTLENWYYGPNTVLMLIYLHYTKIDGMVMMQRKWPAIRNWTSQDAVDRENFEMSKGQIGLVEVIEDDDKEDENEKDAEKQKLRELVYETIEEKFQNVLKEKTELEHMLKEYMEMDELFSGDEKLTLYVKKFKEEFTKGFRKDEERAGTSGVGNDDDNEDGADNNEVDVTEENEATEIEIDAEISVKEAVEEKEADKAREMR
ncbi:hypothetical protein Tco_0536658 [Tanacetum coccineum]